jgi:aryl-alcohol dehydrogenase
MQIKAAIATGAGVPMSVEELTLEAPRDNEVLVRITATGICHTDLWVRDLERVPKPIVLGHEGAGVVEQVGSKVTGVSPGDAVVMTYNSCGECPTCVKGEPAYCYNTWPFCFGGRRPDGSAALSKAGQLIHSHFFGQSSFATYSICTGRNIVRVPRAVPLERLAPLGCGVQTGAGAVLNSLKVPAGSTLAVFGAGSVGLSAIMAARIAGAAKIIAVDVQESRLEMARSLCATHVINGANEDVRARILAITRWGIDFGLDTTGQPAVIAAGVESLAARGAFGLISSARAETINIPVPHLMQGGRSIRGILQGDSVPEQFIPQLIELHTQGKFPFDRLIRFYPFEQINQAMADMDAGKTIKPVLRMS